MATLTKPRPIRGREGPKIPMTEDNVTTNQVKATHAPDGRKVDVEPLLHLVQDILNHATLNDGTIATTGSTKLKEDMPGKSYPTSTTLDLLSDIIDQVFWEISMKALTGDEGHATTVAMLNMLAPYSWDAKLVLTLAAFAFNYGEFWLAGSTALKSLCVVDLGEPPSASISGEVPASTAAMAHVPTAVYWTIRSTVACADQITSLTSVGLEYETSTTEAWELSTLAHKLTNLNEHLQEQNQQIQEKRHAEAYQTLLNLIETNHIDNMKIMKALIHPKDDILPLVDGTTKRSVGIEVLRRKHALLLISGLDISQDELSILEQIHRESELHSIQQYEMVWIPMFKALRSTMPWYSVYNPILIDKAVIRLIKEKWHFRKKPIVVVLDPQGRVVSPNAMHMMWIWGTNAFPFTTEREEALWEESARTLDFLIREGKYIFLYGGDDIEWIRKFTTTARTVAQAARIPLEMAYVGKSGKQEQVRRTIATISTEKLSYTWGNLAMVWFFWTRLESMLFSKIQLGKVDEHIPIMQLIKRLLSFDMAGGWAVLSRGSSIIVNGHGTTVLLALLQYDVWKEQVPTKGYGRAFKEHHDKMQDATHLCCRFGLQSTMGMIPESMRCPDCQRCMEKLITYACCHEEDFTTIND
ncbi:hypothetical protein BT93_F2803 [Corymbia citriodora subsp. variegata]|nr:hypothetical protein BT93_F2803 [Corymbia citriodora subsp. variegata]